jgi:hypothetical protein
MTNSYGLGPGIVTPIATAKQTKLRTILALFVRGFSMNRFDAEQHHDHCLHSTVSSLQNGYGIVIGRVSETVKCLHGQATVRVKRYWLDTAPNNVAAARSLLTMLGGSI